MFKKSTQAGVSAAILTFTISTQLSAAELNGSSEIEVGNSTYVVELEAGASRIHLPQYRFGVDLQGPAFLDVEELETGEDDLGGYQIGAGIYLPSMDIGGGEVTFGIVGSYSDYDDQRTTICDSATGANFCNLMPLFESSSAAFDLIKNTFAGGIVFDTDRDVDLFEIALVAKTPIEIDGMNFIHGFDYQRLSEDFDMTATAFEPGSANAGQAQYNHDLDTDYIGLFIGIDVAKTVADDVVLNLDGKIGVYHRNTDYNGRFFSDQRDFFAPPISQTLGLSDNDVTAIAEGEIELVKMFGNLEVSAFVKGQWISDVPTINYNTTETLPIPAGGGQVGTTLGSESAFSYTIGGGIVIPF
ncbi:MAG: hypothetical protein QNJ29_06710 [Rhizobiaceae bacterium]|nr:hypothetical protein [Rhizobiaceae bacterium]